MKKASKKHIIWSDLHVDYEEWREYLEEEYPDIDESERISLMHNINSAQLEEERRKLDISIATPILVYADFGLWYGRRKGYGLIYSGNVSDCLKSCCEYNEWYIDKYGDFRCTAVHHDGTNYYLYRAIKENISEKQLRCLLNKFYNETVTRVDIMRCTRSIGNLILRECDVL